MSYQLNSYIHQQPLKLKIQHQGRKEKKRNQDVILETGERTRCCPHGLLADWSQEKKSNTNTENQMD